ncbi:MAG: two-component system response regulator RppA [Phormidesmis sp.]
MRVLLVEDEPALGEAIKRVLVNENYVVDWVQDGLEAWHYLENPWTEYTVAVLDWLLPGLSGLELCQRLRSQQNSLPILMLTALSQPKKRIEGLDAGADDYLVKPFVMDELLARLRALQRRAPQVQPQTFSLGNFILDPASNSCSVCLPELPEQTLTLTRKEFQIMAYLMQRPGQIVAGSKLRAQLWDVDSEAMSNVVAAQIRLLRRKFDEQGCVCPIETVRSKGYRFSS